MAVPLGAAIAAAPKGGGSLLPSSAQPPTSDETSNFTPAPIVELRDTFLM
jgi:hypothetical protein